MQKLKDEIAIVTGAGSGIGRATALELARAGASVFAVCYGEGQDAEKLKSEIAALGSRAAAGHADVRSETDVARVFEACVQELGTPGILVNSAGINAAGILLADMSLDHWNSILETNLTGAFLCCRAFIRGRREAGGGGKIVNVTSVHQEIPMRGAAAYDASKGGLGNLTTTLALELAPLRINANNIAPGMVLTPMNQEAIDDPAVLQETVAHIPWKRAAEPEEVARLAVYLASRDADYITGATFVIDGGLSLNLGQGA